MHVAREGPCTEIEAAVMRVFEGGKAARSTLPMVNETAAVKLAMPARMFSDVEDDAFRKVFLGKVLYCIKGIVWR